MYTQMFDFLPMTSILDKKSPSILAIFSSLSKKCEVGRIWATNNCLTNNHWLKYFRFRFHVFSALTILTVYHTLSILFKYSRDLNKLIFGSLHFSVFKNGNSLMEYTDGAV